MMVGLDLEGGLEGGLEGIVHRRTSSSSSSSAAAGSQTSELSAVFVNAANYSLQEI